MRGVSAVGVTIVIVILIVIGYFALQYLPSVITPPTNGIKYKNDVITAEELYVSNLKPYEGADTDIEFLVSNNGDQPVENVVVTFESTGGGFDVIKKEDKKADLRCSDGSVQPTEGGTGIVEWNKCVFDEIASLDAKSVHLTLRAKDVLTDTTYNVRYSIQYNYKGSRLATIPIINPDTRSRPVSKFGQSTPSVGPVVLDFQAGEAREFTEGGKKVTGYWFEYDRTAEVKINLENIGSSSVGEINDTYINTETFTLDTKGILTPSGLCHFKENPAKEKDLLYYCRNVKVDQDDPTKCEFKDENGEPLAMRSIKLPAQLSCNFKPAQRLTVPEVSATILANFEYAYKFENTQPITIRDIKVG